MTSRPATCPQTLEEAYSARVSLAHRKQYGQFFTPPPVADLLARWVAAARPATVLDPAVGTGILASTVSRYLPACHLTAFDTDPLILRFLQAENPASHYWEVVEQDFLRSDIRPQYEGIVANPPYLKFHDYDNLPAIRHVAEQTGVALSGFTNIYALFILKALRQLAAGGHAAFVVPSEFLNADYGVAVKQALLASGCLRHVLVIDFQHQPFADALTTACVLLFAREAAPASTIHFAHLSSVSDLADWTPQQSVGQTFPIAGLAPAVKWRRYYQPPTELPYGPLIPFSLIGKVSRGIATGDNAYFTFSPSRARQAELNPATALRPCISRATDVPGHFFTAAMLAQLVVADKTIYLLDITDENEVAARRYLAEGQRLGVPHKHLPAHRRVWHRPEKQLPAPIWVNVFNRGGLRFVRNEAGIHHLTTFHGVYLHPLFEARLEVVMAYLLTDVARAIFSQNRREYGNGLEKFEPNDLNRALILDLTLLNPEQVAHVQALYARYRQAVLFGQEAEELRLEIDVYFRHVFCRKVN